MGVNTRIFSENLYEGEKIRENGKLSISEDAKKPIFTEIGSDCRQIRKDSGLRQSFL